MSDMTLGQLRRVLTAAAGWHSEDSVVQATTPHGSYTFEIVDRVDISRNDGSPTSLVMLHLREIPTTTTDHTVIRNSTDDDEAPTIQDLAFLRLPFAEDELRISRARNRESNRLFEESQDVAGIAVAEVNRLRKFIAEEFIMEMEGKP